MCGFICTSDKAFFEKLPQDQREKFFQESYKFLKDRYGEKNIVAIHCSLWRDNTTKEYSCYHCSLWRDNTTLTLLYLTCYSGWPPVSQRYLYACWIKTPTDRLPSAHEKSRLRPGKGKALWSQAPQCPGAQATDRWKGKSGTEKEMEEVKASLTRLKSFRMWFRPSAKGLFAP